MQHKWKNKGNTFSILTVLRITYEILNSDSTEIVLILISSFVPTC